MLRAAEEEVKRNLLILLSDASCSHFSLPLPFTSCLTEQPLCLFLLAVISCDQLQHSEEEELSLDDLTLHLFSSES